VSINRLCFEVMNFQNFCASNNKKLMRFKVVSSVNEATKIQLIEATGSDRNR